MKKISLKNLNLKEVEQLSREQLKNVLGGWAGGSDDGGTNGSEGGQAGIWTCTATSSSGQVSSSAESWDPGAMATLNAWVNFWQSAGANPSCTFLPVYGA